MRWEMKSQGVCLGLWLQVTHLSPVLTRGRSWGGPPLLCLLLPSKQHREIVSTPLINESLRLPVSPASSKASAGKTEVRRSHGQAGETRFWLPPTCTRMHAHTLAHTCTHTCTRTHTRAEVGDMLDLREQVTSKC